MRYADELGNVISLKEFHEWFYYDSKTGLLWYKKKKARNTDLNKPAGYIDVGGYRSLIFNRKGYKQHRLIWFVTQGCWPKYEIDHINGIKTDNRLENLRDVHPNVNMNNIHFHRAGKLPGTMYRKDKKKWRALLIVKGKHHYLGHYDSELEAHNAYLKGRRKFKETLYEVRPVITVLP